MGIRIGSTVVNCADLETMTEFWTQALGLVRSSREPDDDQVPGSPVSARDRCISTSTATTRISRSPG
jgi:catechol 2,3-dioxygenase-like lactoylglutathione lyase family enzyme